MSSAKVPSSKELFRRWRAGDAEAGQAMAQRFSDWYYAVATCRLGESAGRPAFDRACTRFAEGVAGIRSFSELLRWAQDILVEEVERAGGRQADGNEPSPHTGHKPPKTLLAQCKDHLPLELGLLEAAYAGRDVEELAEPLGGVPLGILRARYRLKRWLREQGQTPQAIAPDEPVLDHGPLPLYESGRMSAREERAFEQWMLTDPDLCKDIAEFAPFALALRGGLPASPGRSQSMVVDDKPSPVRRRATATGALAVAAVVGAALVFAALVVVAIVFLWS